MGIQPTFLEDLDFMLKAWEYHEAEEGYAWIWNGVPGVWITKYRSHRPANSAEPIAAWVLTKSKRGLTGLVYQREYGRVLDDLVKCCDLSELNLELVKLDMTIPRCWV